MQCVQKIHKAKLEINEGLWVFDDCLDGMLRTGSFWYCNKLNFWRSSVSASGGLAWAPLQLLTLTSLDLAHFHIASSSCCICKRKRRCSSSKAAFLRRRTRESGSGTAFLPSWSYLGFHAPTVLSYCFLSLCYCLFFICFLKARMQWIVPEMVGLKPSVSPNSANRSPSTSQLVPPSACGTCPGHSFWSLPSHHPRHSVSRPSLWLVSPDPAMMSVPIEIDDTFWHWPDLQRFA